MPDILATLLVAFGVAGIAAFVTASATHGKPWESPHNTRPSLIFGCSVAILIAFGAIAALGLWLFMG